MTVAVSARIASRTAATTAASGTEACSDTGTPRYMRPSIHHEAPVVSLVVPGPTELSTMTERRDNSLSHCTYLPLT